MSKGRIQNLNEDFWEFIQQGVAINIMKKFHNIKQSEENKHSSTRESIYTMDCFAEELLECIDGMPVHEVSQLS